MISPTIESLGSLNEPDTSAVRVSWNANPGKYDLRHYTVTVYSSVDNGKIVSVYIKPENDNVSVVLPVPSDVQVYAKITTMSMCDETDDGVRTEAILSASSSKWLYIFYFYSCLDYIT